MIFLLFTPGDRLALHVGDLCNCALGRQVASQDRQAALFIQRIIPGAYDILIAWRLARRIAIEDALLPACPRLIHKSDGSSGGAVFRKSNGSLPISTRVVLGPFLCGAFARLLIYRQRGKSWVEAAPGVYCGRLLTKREALAMRAMGVTGVLDMTAEHAETRPFLEIEYLNTGARSLQEIAYLNVPVLDLTEPSREQLDVDVDVAFIAEHVHREDVYVHCALGISRSVAAAAAYIASQQTEPPPASR